MSETNSIQFNPERPPVRGPIFAGILCISLFMAGVAGWVTVAPLQSAAIAAGSVSLDSYRKTVQHLEGGIVEKILIREGQQVEKDEILIVLDETRAKASVDLLQAQISSVQERLGLISQEIASLEGLHKKGLVKKTRMLAFERRKVTLRGEQLQHMAEIKAARDVIARSKIRAPIAGTVVGLKVHTTNGIVKPGEALLSIVPKDEPLVIEAKVDPNDIDVIHKGLPARVRLTPLNARMVPPFEAIVVWISADLMNEANTGAGYYLVRVKITTPPSELPEGVKLYPGMPAEVILLTGERTVLDYMIAPLTRSFRRAFREQ